MVDKIGKDGFKFLYEHDPKDIADATSANIFRFTRQAFANFDDIFDHLAKNADKKPREEGPIKIKPKEPLLLPPGRTD